jgi:hypothetical protein
MSDRSACASEVWKYMDHGLVHSSWKIRQTGPCELVNLSRRIINEVQEWVNVLITMQAYTGRQIRSRAVQAHKFNGSRAFHADIRTTEILGNEFIDIGLNN